MVVDSCGCHHKWVFFVFQITHADGVSIMQSCLDSESGISSKMIFPVKQPTASNFEVWWGAFYLLFLPSLNLGVPLSWLQHLLYDQFVGRELYD